MSDPLHILLSSVDAPESVFTVAAMAHWPPGSREQLEAAGLLRRIHNATHVACPACPDGHVEEVMAREGPDGRTRHLIRCPEALRVEVPEEHLLQWSIDIGALVKALAEGMGLKGEPKVLEPGRLWRLGKTPWQGANREVLFARGLAWPDARKVVCHIGPNGRPVVLVAERAPPDAVWAGRPPAAVVLGQVATLNENGVEIDTVDLAARVKEADQRVAAVMGEAVTAAEQKRAIRQQVKAEVKSHLEDDVLVAAYKRYGSYRKAADALTDELGGSISKDKIRRAVQRAGGPSEVMETADSASICRTVASHRRDRPKKTFPSP